MIDDVLGQFYDEFGGWLGGHGLTAAVPVADRVVRANVDLVALETAIRELITAARSAGVDAGAMAAGCTPGSLLAKIMDLQVRVADLEAGCRSG